MKYVCISLTSLWIKVDNLLAEVFPTESAVSPGVEDLAGNTALVINHGSPFTGDGLRPTLPNIVQGTKD